VDKGAWKEVKPIYSDEDRSKVVRNFIIARYEGLVKIESFDSILPYLDEKRVKLLYDLKQSGTRTYSYTVKEERCYTAEDAETDFDWLISVVTGAESTSEDTIKQANDQLFIFILALRDCTEIDEHVKLVEPYNWERNLASIAKSLSDFQSYEEKRDLDICNVLTKIHELVKSYHAILTEMTKDYDVNIKKVFKDD